MSAEYLLQLQDMRRHHPATNRVCMYKSTYTHHATIGATVNSRGAGAATEVRAVVPARALPQIGTNRDKVKNGFTLSLQSKLLLLRWEGTYKVASGGSVVGDVDARPGRGIEGSQRLNIGELPNRTQTGDQNVCI